MSARPVGPYGFRVTQSLTGGTPGRLGIENYTIDPTYNTNIIVGDAVKRSGVNRHIERAAAGDTIVGFFKGCQYLLPNGEVFFREYWPASQPVQTNSEVVALVSDDPDVYIEGQMDGALTATDIGQLVDLVQIDAGDLMTPRSGMGFSSASIGSGTQFKLVALSTTYSANAYGNQNDVVAIPADHELHTRAAV